MLKLAMSLYFKLSKSKKSRQCPARDCKPIGFFPQHLWKSLVCSPRQAVLGPAVQGWDTASKCPLLAGPEPPTIFLVCLSKAGWAGITATDWCYVFINQFFLLLTGSLTQPPNKCLASKGFPGCILF